MEIAAWHPGNRVAWEIKHAEMLAFVHRYARKSIPSATFRALMKLSGREMILPGSSLLLAILQTEDGPRVAGLSCVTNYGRGICLVVVHPLYRGRGLGSALLNRQHAVLGNLICRVAPGNLSSLQMCFRAGFSASRLIKSQTGRAELLLEKTHGCSLDSELMSDLDFANPFPAKKVIPDDTTGLGHFDTIFK